MFPVLLCGAKRTQKELMILKPTHTNKYGSQSSYSYCAYTAIEVFNVVRLVFSLSITYN